MCFELIGSRTCQFYQRIFYFWQTKPDGDTSGAGIAYPSGPPNLNPVFSGGCVARSLVLCMCFSFCPFSFGHCVVCPSLIYPFGIFKLFLKQLGMFAKL